MRATTVRSSQWLVCIACIGLAAAAIATAPAQAAPVLHDQGRLLDPANGQPKADGSYTMVFHLYTGASGGVPLWTEIKGVAVSQGRSARCWAT